MKRPIRTLNDLRQHSKDIKIIVREYRGRNVRVLDITSQGDLDLSDDTIRLLIDFPPNSMSPGRGISLETKLFRLLDRDVAMEHLPLSNRIFVKVVNPEEDPPDEREQMLATAKPL